MTYNNSVKIKKFSGGQRRDVIKIFFKTHRSKYNYEKVYKGKRPLLTLTKHVPDSCHFK